MDKNVNVLLLGGAGYIGTHIAHTLKKSGYGVIILDDLSSGKIENVVGFKLYIGDYADFNLLTEIQSKHHCQAIIHLAALTQVGESIVKPLLYYKNNVSKTIDLLKFVACERIRNFIFSSSAAIYKEKASELLTEKQIKSPLNPYGKSKWMIENILEDMHSAYNLQVTCLRYFNVAGANPNYYKQGFVGKNVIPILIRAIKTNKLFYIFGNDYSTPDGTCIRDYIHVEDVALAHVQALNMQLESAYPNKRYKNLRGYQAYNIGTCQGHSVLEVLKIAEKVTGRKLNYQYAPRRIGDPAILVANNIKAKKFLKWQPNTSAIEKIIHDTWVCEKDLDLTSH